MNKNESMSNNSVQVENSAKDEFMQELAASVESATSCASGCDGCYTACFTG